MSLQVWLPLNGNLNNQGLYDTPVTNYGATIDDNGKIGQCYSFNGTNNYISLEYPNMLKPSIVSITAWYQNDNAEGSYLINCYESGGCGLTTGTTANRMRIQIYSGGYSNAEIEIPDNKWHHYAGTFDGRYIKMYLDGTLAATKDLGSVKEMTYHDTTPWHIMSNPGSKGTPSSYGTGKVNDVRIYDHCLSPKEVKEIYKGLMLHYKLDNHGIGIPNLITDTINNPTNNFNDYTGKASVNKISADGTITKVTAITFPIDSETYSNYNLYVTLKRDTSIAVQQDGKIYTLSFKVKASKPLSEYTFLYEYTSTSIVTDVETEWKTVKITGAATGTYSALYVCRNQSNRNKINGGTLYIADLKLEEGSIATPWCPHTSDIIYSQLGLNNNIEYDCSGYNYNGTISSSISCNSNTPRYDTCYYCPPNQRITTPANNCLDSALESFSISFWGYLTNWEDQSHTASKPWLIHASSDGHYIYMPAGTNRLRIRVYDSNKAAKYAYFNAIGGLQGAGWHHFAVTYDGTTVRTYRDGKSYSSVVAESPLWISTKRQITFGSLADNFDNMISDLRIYAIALSAEDVLELYQTSASTDKNNLYCYELKEE